MISGFNTNLSYDAQTYHIQSEDLGGNNPQIVTLAYLEGAVVGRIRTNYGEVLGPNPSPDAVRTLMARQHRQMIADIQAGKFDGGEGR
ncbi:MAG: hypothetical protein ACE5MG_03800 [Candidatus Methylomirabilales bacterium]